MVAGLLGPPGLGKGPTQAEMRIVVDAVGVDNGLELSRGLGELATAEVGTPQRLSHRGLVGSAARRHRKRHRGLLEVAVREQLDAAPVEIKSGLGLSVGEHRPSVGTGPGGVPAQTTRQNRRVVDSPPIVLVARRLPAVGLERLAAACEVRVGGLDASVERLRDLAAGAEAIVSDPTVAVDALLLDAAGERLRVVANFAVGYDNIDLDACQRRGVAATNTPGVLTNATAELALALTLAAARQTGTAEADLRAGRWKGLDPLGYLGLELSGAVFGVVGMGRIGSRYAELVRPLAAEILYTSRSRKAPEEGRLGAAQVDLVELLARSDVISLHLPAAADTAALIGGDELAAMKRNAILINTARGSLLDSAALARALREGEIAAAGLDVYEREPELAPELLNAPNCVLLPHIGSATSGARDAMALLVANDVLAVLEGAEPLHPIAVAG